MEEFKLHSMVLKDDRIFLDGRELLGVESYTLVGETKETTKLTVSLWVGGVEVS